MPLTFEDLETTSAFECSFFNFLIATDGFVLRCVVQATAKSHTAYRRTTPRSTLKPTKGTSASIRTSRRSTAQVTGFRTVFVKIGRFFFSFLLLLLLNDIYNDTWRAAQSESNCRHQIPLLKWWKWTFPEECWVLMVVLAPLCVFSPGPQSPSSSLQHQHMTSPSVKPSTSYYSSWFLVTFGFQLRFVLWLNYCFVFSVISQYICLSLLNIKEIHKIHLKIIIL